MFLMQHPVSSGVYMHCAAEERIWQGIDAQEYVNRLRSEWNECP
jgi:hypothetical protein